MTKSRTVLMSEILSHKWKSLTAKSYLDRLFKDRPLTKREYVKHEGNVCPYCGREDIAGGSFQFEGPSLYQEMSCNFCHKDWADSYKLTGYVE